MTEEERDQFLRGATVDPDVFQLSPDYRALLVAVSGIQPASDSEVVDQLIERAQAHAEALASAGPLTEVPHIAAWREAYRAFGAKPSDYKNSAEALTRRAANGLPRINPLTDLYNALSVIYSVPIGGEDIDHYQGSPRLIRATGSEPFDTVSDGEPVIEHPPPGEVVWVDDAGVTCRRWNWRQGRRTALQPGTTNALFIIDALEPFENDDLEALRDELISALSSLSPHVTHAARTLSA